MIELVDLDAKALKRRSPVWAALSDLFLDTDVSLYYGEIAETLRKSRFSPEEAEHILFEEVGPVFGVNLIAHDRVWSAWPPEHVRVLILDHLALHPLARRAMQAECADVVEHVFHEHWGAISALVWGGRRRAALPNVALPRLQLPRLLPNLTLPRFHVSARGLTFAAPAALLLVLVVFGLYQVVAVARAQARTPALLEQAWSQAGPPITRELPLSWTEALLRIEDPGFRRHHGVDFDTPGQGMTTITQALVKRLYFSRFTPGLAKIEQSLIAYFVLDQAITKDEQLDLFLSLAYFGEVDGESVIGFRNAAQVYYGRALSELEREEFLALVAMLPAPNNLKPGTPENAARVARIDRLLRGQCQPRNWRDVWLEACA